MSDRIGVAVYCEVCGMRKKPIGRSAPTASANSLCDHECDGYLRDPMPGDLWPHERASEFGYSVLEAGSRLVEEQPEGCEP